MGHTVVMGRKNYESMGKPLAGRKNVVMTRDADFSAEGCEIAHSVQDVLERYAAEEVLFIIGGEEIYKQFLPFAQKLYVTVIEGEFAGDTFFPELDTVQWKEVSAKKGRTDEHNPLSYTYYVMESTKNGTPKEG
jgi:dihydrofolate reductase